MKQNSIGLTLLREYLDLLAVLALYALLGVLLYLAPWQPLQLLVGSLVFLFAPGYAFLAALYPTHGEFPPLQRLLAGFGMSIILVGLTGLITTYLLGFTKDIAFVSTSALVLSFSLLAFYQRLRLDAMGDRPLPVRSIHLPSPRISQKGLVQAEYLSIFILLIAFAAFILSSSQSTPQFTEFYILGDNAKLADYPLQVSPARPFNATLGVINHQKTETSYALSYCIGADCALLKNILLDDGARWEQKVQLPLNLKPGAYKISFQLRQIADKNASQELHLWVQVVDG